MNGVLVGRNIELAYSPLTDIFVYFKFNFLIGLALTERRYDYICQCITLIISNELNNILLDYIRMWRFLFKEDSFSKM